MNLKALSEDNFDKTIQSGTLLKNFQDYDIELIFIDEYRISWMGYKIYGLAEKGKMIINFKY